MKYQGSKRRFAKAILHAIDKDCGGIYSGKYQNWIEPFVGGCNMIEHITRLRRFGYDSNRYLIAFYQALQAGWKPPSKVSRKDYDEALNLSNLNEASEAMPACLIGFIGAFNTFGGGWFNSYVYDKPGTKFSLAQEQAKASYLLKPKISSVGFRHCSFFDITTWPSNSIIYLDPPYAATAGYKDLFDNDRFWIVAEKLAIQNDAKVYVSEYKAPNNWRCIWKDSVPRTAISNAAATGIEQLFTL